MQLSSISIGWCHLYHAVAFCTHFSYEYSKSLAMAHILIVFIRCKLYQVAVKFSQCKLILQRKNVLVALGNRSRRTRLWDLFAFINNSLTGGDPRERLRAEYSRMIFGSASASLSNREELRRSNTWRLSEVNANYNVCPTYPSLLVMPASIRYTPNSHHLLFWCIVVCQCHMQVNKLRVHYD